VPGLLRSAHEDRVVGTGIVGRTFALGLQAAGHDVVVGTRDPARTAARPEWAGLDVVELDGLANARGLEIWMGLWVRLMAALGTAEFNLTVVR
jgi:glycine/D-amino acid oxidase-like deaminating enzyme